MVRPFLRSMNNGFYLRTACGKQGQGVGDALIQLFGRPVPAVQLMEYLSILDKQHPAGTAGSPDAVGHHKDGLTSGVDFPK